MVEVEGHQTALAAQLLLVDLAGEDVVLPLILLPQAEIPPLQLPAKVTMAAQEPQHKAEVVEELLKLVQQEQLLTAPEEKVAMVQPQPLQEHQRRMPVVVEALEAGPDIQMAALVVAELEVTLEALLELTALQILAVAVGLVAVQADQALAAPADLV